MSWQDLGAFANRLDWRGVLADFLVAIAFLIPMLWWQYRSIGLLKALVSAAVVSIVTMMLLAIALLVMFIPRTLAELEAPRYGPPDLWLIPGLVAGCTIVTFIAWVTGFLRWSQSLPQEPESKAVSLWERWGKRAHKYPGKPLSLD